MLGCRGNVQCEGDVIHVIAEHLVDLSAELRRVSELDQPFRWPAGRGDGARQTGGPDPRERHGLGRKPREIYVPDLRIETLKVKARDFR
jgi:error-prone DNA polymerase